MEQVRDEKGRVILPTDVLCHLSELLPLGDAVSFTVAVGNSGVQDAVLHRPDVNKAALLLSQLGHLYPSIQALQYLHLPLSIIIKILLDNALNKGCPSSVIEELVFPIVKAAINNPDTSVLDNSLLVV